MLVRFALAAGVLLVLGSCTHRSGPVVSDAAAPPRAAFQLYPAEEAASVKDPHDYKGKALCQRCHLPDLKLVGNQNEICGACHKFHHGNHPVDVVQKEPAAGLPLLAGGIVACHTCHDPHQGKTVLRKSFNELCMTCHKQH